MTSQQEFVAECLVGSVRPGYGDEVVEAPCLMDNEVFGPCVYLTVRYGRTYLEYGIKADGEVFTVR